MTIRRIPRNACETYFMPAVRGRPSGKEIGNYLSANHPLFSKACEVDSRIRIIAGLRFLMVTVLDIPLKTIRGNGTLTRLVTVPAVLASSSHAKRACTIRCGDELVVFGKNPETVILSATRGETPRADVVIDSDEELFAFARKEKITVSLFGFRRRIPVFLAVLLFIAMFASFAVKPRESSVTIENRLVLGTIPAIVSTTFEEIFKAEVDAIYAGGAVIEDYRFDVREKPATNIKLKNGDANIVMRELRLIDSLGDIDTGEVKYDDRSWRYPVKYTARIPVYGKGNSGDILGVISLIGSLEELCASRTWKLSVAGADADPVFTIKVPEEDVPLFPASLFNWCRVKTIAVTALHAARTEGSSLFALTLRFAPAPEQYGISTFNPEKIKAVFGISRINSPTEKTANMANSVALIGKIGDGSTGVYVFGRTSLGKISVTKEKVR